MHKSQIINTYISEDENIVYGIFSHLTNVDECSVISYGIMSCEICGSFTSIYDVYTNYEEVKALVSEIRRQSIPAHLVKDYIIDYVSEH